MQFQINEDEFNIGIVCEDIVDNYFTVRVCFPISNVNIIYVCNTDRFSSDFCRIANFKDYKQVLFCVKVLHHESVKLWCIDGS